MDMLVDTLRELTPVLLAIPWELVLKSSCSADGIVLSHNCLVKTIWGWAWEGSTADDVVLGDNVENLESDRGTRMTDIGRGWPGMHSFVVKMPPLTFSCQYTDKGPKTGARGHYSTTSTPGLCCRHSRRLVLSFLCIMTNERPSYPIVLDRTGLTVILRQTTRAGTSLFWWWVDFRMRESRVKVRHSDQTQGDWPRNAPHVQCEQTDY